MTWAASLLPDDAFPPDSSVGKMLNPEPVSELYKFDDVTWDSPKEVKMVSGRIAGSEGEPIIEISFNERAGKVQHDAAAAAMEFIDECDDDFMALAASERAELPLWRVMQDAAAENPDNPGVPDCGNDDYGLMIEALRDWLPASPPLDLIEQWGNEPEASQRSMVCHTMAWVRALLDKQASITREGDDG